LQIELWTKKYGQKLINLFFPFIFLRYFAIVYPFRSLLWIKTHKISAIIIIWFSGIAVGVSQLIQSRAVPFTYSGNSYYDCREEWTDTEGKIYTIFVFSITFVIPIVSLIFVYSRIAFHIMRNVLPGNPDRNRDEVRVNQKIKVSLI
jgi:neuropeptide Y receptor